MSSRSLRRLAMLAISGLAVTALTGIAGAGGPDLGDEATVAAASTTVVRRAEVPPVDVTAVEPRPAATPDRAARTAEEPAGSSAAADSREARDSWTGIASWYGPGFEGQSTANGETFDPDDLTAAHRTLPFGSEVRVTFLATGESVVVRINDRGPYVEGREIDLSEAAAERIGLKSAGHGEVRLELL